MTPFKLILALTITCLAASPCGAQGGEALPDPGARIRVLRAGDRVPQEATLVAFGRDTMIVQLGGCCAVDTIPIASLAAVDVSRGMGVSESRVLGGMAFGLIAGVGAGWAIGVLGCRAPNAGEFCVLGIPYWATILGAGGLAAGALWGMESKTERWDRIYPPRRASLFVSPSKDRGFAIGVVIPLDIGSIGDVAARL
ncbi:MAG TPA: hypothetical protein VIQ74_07345 [Gemmatimonadaceae bacterium]|jgi:hypothetical protein